MSRLDLNRIQARCIEDGDCLIWTGKTHANNGSPAGTEWVGGKDHYVGVRRRAYEEYHGVTLKKGQEIVTCGNPACLAKAHLERVTRGERLKRVYAKMDAGMKVRRSMALSAANVGRRKLKPEQVREILESEDGPYVVAKRLGVSGVIASRIRRGTAYRDCGRTNPFAGLMGG
jgi:hypothetical protein